jgi:acetylornithine deacetylase/succinyl-diaminopimelate desuccinylase-like protein
LRDARNIALILLICLRQAAAQPDVEARAILKELVEINTTNPNGNNTVAARAVERRFLDAGFDAKDIFVGGPAERKYNLVARLRGSEARKPILLMGHLDVVEALPSDWTTSPFQLVEKDGYFYGRGTQDMKSDDAIMIETLIRLKRESYRPGRDIILALTADEESGPSNGMDWLLKNHRDLVDPEYALNADAGGIVTVDGKPHHLSLNGAEKIYADFQLTSRNSGGHSSLPSPDNAIYHLSDALGRIARNPFPVEFNPITRGYFERIGQFETPQRAADLRAALRTPPDPEAIRRLSADPGLNATMRTTCVATRISGGHANNALPQTAQAIVNCRILPGHSPAEVEQDLKNIVSDPAVAIQFLNGGSGEPEPAPVTKGQAPEAVKEEFMAPLITLAARFWPNAPIIPGQSSGASDGKYTRAAGIPTYGFSSMAVDRDDVRAHGKDERVRVSAFNDGVDFFYLFLKALTPPPVAARVTIRPRIQAQEQTARPFLRLPH